MHDVPVRLGHVAATIGYRVAIVVLVTLLVLALGLMLTFPLVLHAFG